MGTDGDQVPRDLAPPAHLERADQEPLPLAQRQARDLELHAVVGRLAIEPASRTRPRRRRSAPRRARRSGTPALPPRLEQASSAGVLFAAEHVAHPRVERISPLMSSQRGSSSKCHIAKKSRMSKAAEVASAST